ncbi:hypothetical protein [Phreatobacter sp.]|uniref:hypothetical protein n=1 Tax=Phreatobacter sp. TaxID=1966341 RepID=UPI0026012723|nr:hypothetical protein [Phreatobacter sp.]
MIDGRPGTAEMILWTATLVMVLMLALAAVIWTVDKRLINEVSVWAKPMKFAVSLAIHMATLALIVGLLGAGWRTGTLLAIVAAACALASLGEMIYIIVQAARQQASHFNLATPFTRAMYNAMATGAVVITLSAAVVGTAAFADRDAAIAPALRLALLLGLVGGAVLTLVTAFTIGSRLSPHVGLHPAGGARMAVTGWSLVVGDLRVAHFLATHMIQAVPLVGLIAARRLPPAVAMTTVWLAAIAWTGLVLASYQQALTGRPLPRLF